MVRSRSFGSEVEGWGLKARDVPEKESRKVSWSDILGNMLMTDLLANTFIYLLVGEIYL